MFRFKGNVQFILVIIQLFIVSLIYRHLNAVRIGEYAIHEPSASADGLEIKNDTIQLTDFEFCKHLSGSYFNTVFVCTHRQASLNANLTHINKVAAVRKIDSTASHLYESILKQTRENVDYSSTHRFACYNVAIGNTLWSPTTLTQYLSRVPLTYFPTLHLPPLTTPRLKALIAYVVLLHNTPYAFQNAVKLIDALYSPNALVLIHVDKKAFLLYAQLQYHLQTLPFMVRQRVTVQSWYVVQWGMSSIILTQLKAFQYLYMWGDWDFCMNVSGADYPIRSTAFIHARLNVDTVYMTYFEDEDTRMTRLRVPVVLGKNQEGGVKLIPRRLQPYDKVMKHHQWMILPRSFVRHLRTSSSALMALAFVEHTWIPDEHYFYTALQDYGGKVVNDFKRFVTSLTDNGHPHYFVEEDKAELLKCGDDCFFVRKVIWEKEVCAWFDQLRADADQR